VDLERCGASHLVMLSSAMVYGAVENNPIPLTEEAVVRPDHRFAYARQLATAEWMVDEWRRSRPGRRVTVLRPAIMMSQEASSGLARAVAAGFGQRFARTDPGSQFVHLDDVAAAVVIGVNKSLDGVYNVAPDGWIPGERLVALTGDTLRLPVPDRVGEVIEALRWRFRRGPIPPGLRAYTREPWLISNDKLKGVGWLPTVTNEQAYVEGTEGTWWSTISPQRRQELALGAVSAAVLLVIGAVISLGIGWRRRRRRERN
jgi:nucleoside-diphosphate-sugar epimerase